MRLDFLEAPGGAADRLGAHLLGNGDAVALDLAVGVVGADRDPEPVGGTDQHWLDLARTVVAQHLDALGLGQHLRGGAVVDRHPRRRLDADRLQFLDVMIEGRHVAAGPAGNHQILYVDNDFLDRALGVAVEFQPRHRQRTAS